MGVPADKLKGEIESLEDFKKRVDGVHAQYSRVHARLTGLSRVLGAQIEAMGIAVHGADVGFGNLEDDLKRRFWKLQGRALEHRQQREAEKRSGGRKPKDEATEVTY